MRAHTVLTMMATFQSWAVLEGKENFYEDYGCGLAVPIIGSAGACASVSALGGLGLGLLLTLMEVAAAAGAGAEAALMGAIAAFIASGTIAMVGLGCMIAPCGQQVALDSYFVMAYLPLPVPLQTSCCHPSKAPSLRTTRH